MSAPAITLSAEQIQAIAMAMLAAQAAPKPAPKPAPEPESYALTGWQIKLSADKSTLTLTVPLTLNYGHTTQRRTGYVLAGDFKAPLAELGKYSEHLRLFMRPPVIMAMPPKGQGLPRV